MPAAPVSAHRPDRGVAASAAFLAILALVVMALIGAVAALGSVHHDVPTSHPATTEVTAADTDHVSVISSPGSVPVEASYTPPDTCAEVASTWSLLGAVDKRDDAYTRLMVDGLAAQWKRLGCSGDLPPLG